MCATGSTYRLVHRTRYLFAESVQGGCQLEARLQPRRLDHQAVSFHQLVVKPSPSQRDLSIDSFGNAVEHLDFERPFGTLELSAVSTVHARPPSRPEPSQLALPWEEVAAASDPRGAAEPPDTELSDYARQSFRPGASLGQALDAWLVRLGREFRFDPSATRGDTPVATFFRQRRGVCQDFTRLTLVALESLGLATRFVSGYATHARGQATRSHAWAAIRLPDGHWLDLDPTHGRIGPLDHVTLAWGRHDEDVAPVRGVACHQGAYRLETRVTVAAA